MNSNIIKNYSLKHINWKLYFPILLMLLLPVIYRTLRINYLGNLPIDWGYNIASQISWVNILYEVLQEGLILPLFFIIGKTIKNKIETSNKIKTSIIFVFGIHIIVGILLAIFISPILVLAGQKQDIIIASASYIRLEIIAITISIIYKLFGVVFILLGKNKLLYITTGIQMLLSIFTDTFFISAFHFSLNLGVNGIAIGNIIVSIVLCIFSLIALQRLHIIQDSKLDFAWLKSWLKIGWKSGLESFVRNAAFFFMILRLINQIEKQGDYWVANNFVWGWLLLPILALGDLIKTDIGTSKNMYKEQNNKTGAYVSFTILVAVFWLITIPFWKWFLIHIMGSSVESVNTIVSIVYIQTPFYIIFAFNNIIDSIFYGLGRTDLMLYQSIIINGGFYTFMLLLYIGGWFVPTLFLIAIMFGVGMALDSIVTFIMYLHIRKKYLNQEQITV